jgi:GNAT superfamily N-acetyltransferase
MPELTYRAATKADLPFIVNLLAVDDVAVPRLEWPSPDAPQYAEAFDAIAADPNQAVYIAESDGTPIGTFQLTFIPGLMRNGLWRGLIETVHVSPEQRNNGFGGQMIRWVVERCRDRGCRVVQLTSNKTRIDAHRFYRTLGFSQSHEGFKLPL